MLQRDNGQLVRYFLFFFRIVLENACNWLTCCSIIQFERIIRKFLFIFNVAE